MESGIVTKYSASAGSGKTYRLTGIYLSKLFRSGSAYKRILAVTFTNKAAADMKRKILSQLFLIANGGANDITDELIKETGYTHEKLAAEAKALLGIILHDYSGFNVGTIDSFFQKIIRSFTREIGLQHGYIVEIDHTGILEEAVNRTISDSANDPGLKRWILQYAYSRLEEGKGWNLKDDIMKLAGEIFKERFRLMDSTEREKIKDREFLVSYIEELKATKKSFETKLRQYYQKCDEILKRNNADAGMFYRGNSGGIGSFLKSIADTPDGIYKPLNTIVSKVLESPPVWTAKSGPTPELRQALDEGFADIFTETLKYYQNNYTTVNTVLLVTENIYILGILADILKNVHEITTAENRFLLSDAGELLWLLIKDDQTPFIYEKAGSIYENFMIDEFQDTSLIQWNNFRPLIENSLAGGHNNLVVGDVKQSIYRWRNSDWRIIEGLLDKQIGSARIRTESLNRNWRSRENIILFNNSIFSTLPARIDASDINPTGSLLLGNIYRDVIQECPRKNAGGCVRVEFLGDDENSFEELSLLKLPALIEEFQEKGYDASEIGILVRTNIEGAKVLKTILNYRETATPEKKKKYNYNIVSAESLLLSQSPVISFIISFISYSIDPEDMISLSLMLRNWLMVTGRDPLDADLSDIRSESEKLFPEGYKSLAESVKELPLYEAVEKAIKFFGLGGNHNATAYLNAFQDCLLGFSGNTSSEASAFLEWWNTSGVEKSVVLSDNQNAMRVMTIHKSKGLEFSIVILPFTSWNLGHGNKTPVLWLTHTKEPFSRVQLIPVRYKSAMLQSDFADDYNWETYFAHVDNLNLLYVAFTRAVDALVAFCPSDSGKATIASQIHEAFLKTDTSGGNKLLINLNSFFDNEKKVFSFGDIPVRTKLTEVVKERIAEGQGYFVNSGYGRLRLKLKGENLFTEHEGGIGKKLNYGRIMHEVFESVITPDDIGPAIQKMAIEGRIPQSEMDEIEKRISVAISRPEVKEWFRPGLRIMNEAEILTADGSIRRPDRIIIDNDKIIIVDFKFGIEKDEYLNQVNNYRKLLSGMGYRNIEAWLWYVDIDVIVRI